VPRAAVATWLALAGAGATGALLGWGGGDGGAGAGGWERAASMSQRRSYLAAAQEGPLIYTAGGMVGETGRPLATFTRYDARVDTWTTLPRLPVATRAAAAAALDGRVYVLGGTTPTGNTAAVRAWDGRRWRAHARLPAPRFNHAAVVLGGRLYALGGFHRLRERREVFVYEPTTDRWRRASPLPRATHAFAAVAFHGEIWLVGGRRGERVLREVWIYDPRRDAWRAGPSLPSPMELLGAAVAGGEIHAVWESTYQIYSARTGRWRAGPPPGVTRHALRAFHVDGWLYTLGGCTTALRDSPVVERISVR
jgi:Kelch motif protein